MIYTNYFFPSPNEVSDTIFGLFCPSSLKKKKKPSPSLQRMSSTSPKRIEGEEKSPAAGSLSNMNGNRSISSRFLQDNRDVLLGPLPDDFLRFDATSRQRQIEEDERTALAIAQQQQHPVCPPGYTFRSMMSTDPIIGRLDLMILEAKLVKNYGLTRMDPYVRIRFGMNQIYESQTCVNGSKNPKWNKMFHVFLPEGVDSFHLQIMDEKTFSDDEEIAFLHYEIPEDVLKHSKMKEEWIDLQGRQGKEGVIGFVIKFTPIPVSRTALNQPGLPVSITQVVPGVNITPAPVVLTQGTNLPPVYVDRNQGPPAPPVVISEEDINQLRDMFPSVDVEVIKTLLDNERGNKDRVINQLLSLTNN